MSEEKTNIERISLHADPKLSAAWGPWYAHEYITYYSIMALDKVMNAKPVAVKVNPHYGGKLWPAGPRHVDIYKESYQQYRQFDLLWSFDHKKRNGDYARDVPSGKSIEPWKILVLYSTEPDHYMDEDLYLHKNQKLTGGSRGWRHMHFKMFGTTYGIAPQSFRVYKDWAGLCFENGNDYWGWRNLSRAGHYLADLGNPFHVKAMPVFFLMRNIHSRSALLKIVSAMHQSYEIYVERRFREGFEPFERALRQGATEGYPSGENVHNRLVAYIERTRKKLNPIFYELMDHFGRELLNAFSLMDENRPAEAAPVSGPCAAEVINVIFAEAKSARLDFLDKRTVEILVDVGRMLGALFADRSDPKKAP